MNHSGLKHIILGSTSPFRKALLEKHGYSVDVLGAIGDEKTVLHNDPKTLSRLRAEFKGGDVASQVLRKIRIFPDTGPEDRFGIVLACDQVLDFNGHPIDKALSRLEAKHRLEMFSGNTHVLQTAFCLYKVDRLGMKLLHSEVVSVPMNMRRLSSSEIEAYLDTEEWMGVVGCYRFEGAGKILFMPPFGEESAIIGLPIPEFKEAMSSLE